MQANARKVQKRLRGKARKPAQQAADVVEHVLRTDGDDYLQSHQHKLAWWKLSLVDVKLFLVLTALLSLGCVILLAQLIVRATCRLAAKCFANLSALLGRKLQHKDKAT